MRITSIIFTILSVVVFATPSSASKPIYTLSWQDHFNGSTLNDTFWSKLHRSLADWNRYMSKHPALYEQKRGRLRLFAKVNKGIDTNDTVQYLTGGISTLHKKSIKYGKIEVRARIKGAHGTWPAIWLMPLDKRNWVYPQRAEIDIMECLHTNPFVYQTIHTYYTEELKQKQNPPYQAKVNIKFERYNIYTLEILPDELIFSINGKKTFHYPRLKNAPKGQYPFGVESYLMIDMQVGGAWPKSIEDSTLPAWMDIDYVKFYDYVIKKSE